MVEDGDIGCGLTTTTLGVHLFHLLPACFRSVYKSRRLEPIKSDLKDDDDKAKLFKGSGLFGSIAKVCFSWICSLGYVSVSLGCDVYGGLWANKTHHTTTDQASHLLWPW